MNKYKTTELLNLYTIPTPRNMLLDIISWNTHTEEKIAYIQKNIGFPCIVKPHDDGCSVLVSRARSEDELISNLTLLFQSGKQNALIEEFIQGIELTIGVIGNEKPYALPPSQSVASDGILSLVEKFLPGAGQNITPALLPAEALALAQETAVAAYLATGCSGYARIDCFYQDATQSPTHTPRVVILEINSLPALTPATCLFHQAAEIGMKPMELIEKIIEYGIEKHKKSLPTQKSTGDLFVTLDIGLVERIDSQQPPYIDTRNHI